MRGNCGFIQAQGPYPQVVDLYYTLYVQKDVGHVVKVNTFGNSFHENEEGVFDYGKGSKDHKNWE